MDLICRYELIIKCWSSEPNQRPSFATIIQEIESESNIFIEDNTSNPNPQMSSKKEFIILRRIGQKEGGSKVIKPKTLKGLLDKASEVFKTPILQIRDENYEISDIDLIENAGIYYCLSQDDINRN